MDVEIPRGKARASSPEHNTWRAMRKRCYYEAHHNYPSYGGRGITVHEPWRVSFDQFVRDMGNRPPGHTLDRIDPDGNYEPGNVRWATHKQQAQNRRQRAHS